MKFRGGEFSTGTKANFQSELTNCPFAPKLCQKSLVLIPPISLSRQFSTWPTGGSDVALDETGAEG